MPRPDGDSVKYARGAGAPSSRAEIDKDACAQAHEETSAARMPLIMAEKEATERKRTYDAERLSRMHDVLKFFDEYLHVILTFLRIGVIGFILLVIKEWGEYVRGKLNPLLDNPPCRETLLGLCGSSVDPTVLIGMMSLGCLVLLVLIGFIVRLVLPPKKDEGDDIPLSRLIREIWRAVRSGKE